MYYQNNRYHCFFNNQSQHALHIWEQFKPQEDKEN